MVRLLKYVIGFILILLIFKAFIFEAYKIPSGSMKNTLLEGDFIIVNKSAYSLSTPHELPFFDVPLKKNEIISFSKPQRNDVIAFQLPAELYNPGADSYVTLVKRVIALPGDTLQIINGEVFINSQKFRNPEAIDFNLYEKPDADIDSLINKKLFPYTTKWQMENYGPIIIPAQGMKVELKPDQITLWQNAINNEFGKKVVSVEGTVVAIKGRPEREYTFKENYFFVMGDNRGNSLDSRYFGFIPEKSIIGKALIIYWSQLPKRNSSFSDIFSSIRFERLMRSVN